MVVDNIDIVLSLISFIYLVIILTFMLILFYVVGLPPIIQEVIAEIREGIKRIRSRRVTNSQLVTYTLSNGLTTQVALGNWINLNLNDIEMIEYPSIATIGQYVTPEGQYIHVPGDEVDIPLNLLVNAWIMYM